MRITVQAGGIIFKCQGAPMFIAPEWDGPILDGKTGQPVTDNDAVITLIKQMDESYPGNVTREMGPVDITI
tara:strand:+ start:291 stop:503 length:213 start_codon:yes stop_codon:yes gene_type:complete